MPSTYSNELRLELMADGEQSSLWGQKTNSNLGFIEDAISGLVTIATTGGDTTLTAVDGATDQARFAMIKVTGVLVSNAALIVPDKSKTYLVWNATSGAYTVTIKTTAGAGVVVLQGANRAVHCDGTDVLASGATTSAQLAATLTDETGSGALVFATSPTLVTPVLGVATATSINKLTLTAPATSATLTIANGKTLTSSNTLTLTGTDGTTMTFPTTSATIARTDAANTFTGTQTISALVATTVNGNTITTGTGTLTLGAGKTLTLTDSVTHNTNTMTFAGTQVLTTAATKNVTFADAFATSGAFGLTLTSTALTNVTLPTTGTLATLAGSEVFTNKTLTSPTINGTVATTGLTLPALTLGGAVTGGSQNVSGLGTVGCGAITSSGGITAYDGTGIVLTGRYDAANPTSGGGYFQLKTNNVNATSGGLTVLTDNAGTLRQSYKITETGATSYHEWNAGGATQLTLTATSLTLGAGITSISGGTNPSLNIGTGALTCGSHTSLIQTTAGVSDLISIGTTGSGGTGRGVGILFNAATSGASANAARISVLQETAGVNPNSASMHFYVADYATYALTERMKIDNTGLVSCLNGLAVTGTLSATGALTSGNHAITGTLSTTGLAAVGGAGTIGQLRIKQAGSDNFASGLVLQRSSTLDSWATVVGADNVLYTAYANNASGADATGDFAIVTGLSSTGLAVTGTLSATGNLTASGTTHTLGGDAIVPTILIKGDATNEKHIDWYQNGTLKFETYYASGAGTYVLRGRTPSLVPMMTMTPATPEARIHPPLVTESTTTSTAFIPSSSTVPTNGMYLGAANTLTWSTNSAEKMRLDASGNLGIGVTPSAWNAVTYDAIDISTSAAFVGTSTIAFVTQNTYNSGSNWISKLAGKSSYYYQSAGAHVMASADSVTAGAITTPTQVLAVEKDKSLALQGATSATGCGIAFPATQVASADANTLDDYEEGTWTPTLVSSGATFTYVVNSQAGKYIKIGNVIHCYGVLAISAKSGGTAANSLSIGGLPFAVGTGVSGAGSSLGNAMNIYNDLLTVPANYTLSGVAVPPVSTELLPYYSSLIGDTTARQWQYQDASATGGIQFYCSYIV